MCHSDEDEKIPILAYGFSEKEFEFLKHIISWDWELVWSDAWQDFFNDEYPLILANLDDMSENIKYTIAKYFSEIEPKQKNLIITKYYEVFGDISSVHIDDSIFDSFYVYTREEMEKLISYTKRLDK